MSYFLLYPKLWLRPRPKSVDFHDAENRQQPYPLNIQHKKDPLSARLAWMHSAKLNSKVQILPSPGECTVGDRLTNIIRSKTMFVNRSSIHHRLLCDID
ncbi:hypothetical protein TNCV_4656371 [Trichonephila clavipes]|nr:hypothetical protein TNCV_4656371 [Trichonephila clavipes]